MATLLPAKPVSICLTLALALATCFVVPGQDVKTKHMPGTDFSKYHTYKWVAIEGGGHPDEIADAQIKQSVDSQLSAKGFSKTGGENADLYVGYQVAVDKEK